MNRVRLDHCPDCAAYAVGLETARLPRTAVEESARLGRKAHYSRRLRWNLKASPSKTRELPRLWPVS